MTTPWLEARRKGLGGSDIAALLGVSKWGSPLTLWADKTGKAAEVSMADKEYIEWGNRLEGPILEAYWERVQRVEHALIGVDSNDTYDVQVYDHGGDHKWMFTNLEHPWALATPDALINEYHALPWEDHADYQFQGQGVLEVKTTNAFAAKDWDDGPPPYYEVQGQHYLLVTGLQWCSFAVLIGGQELRVFDMPRKDIVIDKIIEVGSYFWEKNVLADVPPKATGVGPEAQMIAHLYPSDSGESVNLGEDGQMQVAVIRKAETYLAKMKDSMADATKAKDAARNNIRMMMGEASGATTTDGTVFTYKTSTRKGYVIKPKITRTLRMKRGRQG